MKSFVVFCVVLVAGIHAASVPPTPAQPGNAHHPISECIKESGVRSEVLAEAKEMNFLDDARLKKFIFCFLEKTGKVDGDGKLNIDAAFDKQFPLSNRIVKLRHLFDMIHLP